MLPRMMTVDPTGELSRLARAAVAILERPTIQIDVPSSLDALEELGHANFNLVIVSFGLDEHMQGGDFAMRVKEANPETAVIVVASANIAGLAEDIQAAAPFLYLQRPIDGGVFIRAVDAGLNGEDVLAVQFEAVVNTAGQGGFSHHIVGAIPSIDKRAAATIIHNLLEAVSPMAVMLSDRAGTVVHETGAVGYFNREELTKALLPSIITTYEMSKIVGGKASSLEFFDGERYDVFVLSVGIHHTLSLIFDGAQGRGQFGAVNRYGRRAAEDLVTLIGAGAFLTEAERDARATFEMKRAAPVESTPEPEANVEPKGRRKRKGATGLLNDDSGELAAYGGNTPQEPLILRSEEFEAAPLPSAPTMEPIGDIDFDIFDPNVLASMDMSEADALFDLDNLTDLATSETAPQQRKDISKLSYDDARELGILP